MSTSNINHSTNKTENQFVTFKLDKDLFGIEVMNVKEVLYLIEMTHLPDTVPFMKGVIDLRGMVVPLIDLRIKFNFKEREYDNDTVILIVEAQNMLVGYIVDQVFDVLNLTVEKYHETPHFTKTIEQDSVAGIAQSNDQLIVILNVNKIFSVKEIHGLSKSKTPDNIQVSKIPVGTITT